MPDGTSTLPSAVDETLRGISAAERSPLRLGWDRFLENKPAVLAASVFFFFVLAASFGPMISPHGADVITSHQFEPPSSRHWFGTDVHGRDLLTRILMGARISFVVGAVGAIVSLIIGVFYGATAGFVGGRVDSAMMRFVDILYALPSIIFVIVLITTLEEILRSYFPALQGGGKGIWIRLVLLFVGLGAVSWLTMARIVRGQVLSIREQPYIEAARSLGLRDATILTRHILPNVTGVVLAYTALTVPSVILYESFLSFLGLGIQPPMASLGSLIAEGAGQLNPIRVYWWLIVFPVGTMAAALISLNFFSDGLRDAFDRKGA